MHFLITPELYAYNGDLLVYNSSYFSIALLMLY